MTYRLVCRASVDESMVDRFLMTCDTLREPCLRLGRQRKPGASSVTPQVSDQLRCAASLYCTFLEK